MISKGVEHANDILKNTGQFLGYYDFMEKYNIQLNFVDFYNMTHPISRKWVKDIENKLDHYEMEQCLIHTLLQQKKINKWAYQKLKSSVGYHRSLEEKWAIF